MKVAAIMIARDEGELLRLNIEYHTAVGFDHFFIMNHCSEDDTAQLLSLFANDLVTVVNEPSPEFHQLEYQMRLINDALRHNTYDWIFPLDVDEFIHTTSPLKQMLVDLERRGITYACLHLFNMLHNVRLRQPYIHPLESEYGYYPWKEREWEQPSSFYKSFCKPHPHLRVFPGGHFFPSLPFPPYNIPTDSGKLFHYSMRGDPERLIRKWKHLSSSRLQQSTPQPNVWWEAYYLMDERLKYYEDRPDDLLRDWFESPRTFWGTVIEPNKIIQDTKIRDWWVSFNSGNHTFLVPNYNGLG